MFADTVGFEPTAAPLTAGCSAIELHVKKSGGQGLIPAASGLRTFAKVFQTSATLRGLWILPCVSFNAAAKSCSEGRIRTGVSELMRLVSDHYSTSLKFRPSLVSYELSPAIKDLPVNNHMELHHAPYHHDLD